MSKPISSHQIAPAGDCASSGPPLQDRWLEGDFRFFDKENPAPSVDAFFERFREFFLQGSDGVVGIMINVGWFADVVLAYPGEADDRIPLAVFKPLFGEHAGQTMGEDVWTYGQIAGVVSAIREGASKHLGREDFRVGLLLLGWTSIYYAHTPVWFREHPESFRWGRTSLTDPPCRFLDWAAKLRPDQRRYAAFTNGIPQGIPLPEFFAAQWAELSADVGFDTINLRDGMLGLSNYRHASPAWDSECFEGVRLLLRLIKAYSPETMTIGYSVAGSAMAELRCHSLDLRTLAKDGFLDAWITQSWGCNWIEQKRLELTPAMQTAIILAHRALLEGTGVKHYPVLNLLDAYEFLTVKPFADRWQAVKWEIWAYSHAALIRYWNKEGTWGMGEGAPISLPSGFYGAWFHVREQLLDAQSTDLLVKELGSAVADARDLLEIGGPTMVIHDEFCRRKNQSSDSHSYDGEHIDETVGLLIRAGVPVLSSCRILERDYSQNHRPLILHNPEGLPLDFLDAIKSSPLCLVVGPENEVADFSAPSWNPAETLDPLGDARFLREDLMPEEVRTVVREVVQKLEGPRLSAAPEACLHFHFWQSQPGSWKILLGNVEVGAKAAQFELVVGRAWLEEQGIELPVVLQTGTQKITGNESGDTVCFPMELAPGQSKILQLAPSTDKK